MSDSDQFLESIEKRLCPDMDKLKDFWKIKGGYSNSVDRFHVHLEITKCNIKFNPNCKNDT